MEKKPHFGAPALLVQGAQVMDSNESVFFLRVLEYIKTQVIETEYTALKARKLIPVSTEAGPGAQYITWRQFDKMGQARMIRDYSDDLPRIDVLASEFINNPVRGLGASIGYNVQEIRSAQMAGGVPLDTRRAQAAQEAIRRLENKLALKGDSVSGLVGFLNSPNMSQIVLPNDGAGSSILWKTKTADQILRDMNLIANSIVKLTRQVEQPDTLLLSTDAYNIAATKRIGHDSPMTVLEFFLKTNPYIEDVETLVQLDAFQGGFDRAIAYQRSPLKLTMEVPMDVIQHEPEKRGLEYIVPMESRFGGVLVYKPLSIAYADGM